MDTPHKGYWLFKANKEEIKFKPNWHFAANNGRALCQAAALGMGITQTPEISAANYVAQGQLIEVLQNFSMPPLATRHLFATAFSARQVNDLC